MTRLLAGSTTDVGRRRQINQDMVLEGGTIFAIADGMGGHVGGEVASLAAIEALRDAFRQRPTADGLADAITAANDAVGAKAQSNAELRSMGTTLTAVALVEEGDDELLVLGHIGDSRAYLFRDGELSQLTQDHSVPEELMRQGHLTAAEAAVDPRRHILTRVLGPSFGDGPDLQNLIPYKGDRLLICSDGLYNEVDEGGIAQLLRTTADPAAAARALVDLANANGGGDNISAIVIDVVDDDGRAEIASAALAAEDGGGITSRGLMTADERNAELRRLSRDDVETGRMPWDEHGNAPDEHQLPVRRLTLRVAMFLLVLVLVVGGAAAAIGWYARGSYFVGVDEGQVAIFKGRPGGLLWFQPTVSQRTSMSEAEVPAARADDVHAGHEVASIEEARRYVRNLQDDDLEDTAPSTTTETAPPTTTAEPTTPTSTP